jgi:hypothetical protein
VSAARDSRALRSPLSFWRAAAKGAPAVKVAGSGLRKCLPLVKALIKKKGGVYFCEPVSCACCRARAAYPQRATPDLRGF